MGTNKKLACTLCAAAVLTASLPMQAAAAEETTLSGIAFSEVPTAVEDYASTYPNDYVSFAAAVVSRDDVLYSGAFGYADRESGVKADSDTVYEWGSVSKTLVWVSVMQLWEQGKLDLEQDIRTYLPDDFFHNLNYDQPITMLNLMNHTGGWGENVWSLETDDPNNVPTLEEALQDTEPAQLFSPGETSSYSNWGAALAGFIVERISGESFADYAHQHILDPLGMEHTSVTPTCSDNAWVQAQRQKLVCYTQTSPETWISAGSDIHYIKLYPAGSVTGTIDDMAKYAQSLIQEPCPLFENQDTLEMLLSPSLTLGDTELPVICHGFFAEQHGDHTLYWHNGATTGCTANLQIDPEGGTAVVALMNGAGDPISEIPKLIFGEATADLPTEMQGNITEHEDLSGVYFGLRGMWHGPLKVVSLLSVLPLIQTDPDSFSAAGVAELDRVADHVLRLTQGDAKMLCTTRTMSDGASVIDLGGQSYKTEQSMLIALLTVIVYIVIMLSGILLLLIKLIQRIAKKRKRYIGMGWMTLAQLMRVVSVVAVGVLLSLYGNQYGITKPQGYAVCGVEAVCLLVFAAAVISSLRGLFTKDPERAGRFKYFVNFLANGISVFAVIALELIRFWGI